MTPLRQHSVQCNIGEIGVILPGAPIGTILTMPLSKMVNLIFYYILFCCFYAPFESDSDDSEPILVHFSFILSHFGSDLSHSFYSGTLGTESRVTYNYALYAIRSTETPLLYYALTHYMHIHIAYRACS